jgi:DNA polymerase-3 subunit gamma/tau
MNGIAENKPAEALAIVDDLVMRGHDLRNFCRDVLGHIRDLLVVKVSGDPMLLDSSSAQTSALQQQASQFSESDLVRFFHSLAETEANLKDAANPRYQVEVALVKLMEMRRLASLGDLVARIAELESALRTGRAPAERKSPQTAPAAASGNRASSVSTASTRGASASGLASSNANQVDEISSAAPAPAPPADLAAAPAGSLADQIKTELERRKRKLLAASMSAATRVDLEGDDLTIEFSPDAKHSRDTMAKPDNVKILRETCADICGRAVGIRFVVRDSETNDAPLTPEEDQRRSKQNARQAAGQNPTVQQVLKTFGGEIVDVKTL